MDSHTQNKTDFGEQGGQPLNSLPEVPQIARERTSWSPVSERLPEVCKPVIGYADRWVDSEYNEMGMRECFRNDDYWQSAAWNNYQDCWDAVQGPPDYWTEYPAALSDPSGNENHLAAPSSPKLTD